MLENFIIKAGIVSGLVLLGIGTLIIFSMGYVAIYHLVVDGILFFEKQFKLRKYRLITLNVAMIVLILLYIAYTFVGLLALVMFKNYLLN